ncbi:MFS transporter [Amphibiibacter pelophylacis]|uniref:MFS transporter n=1 Tax=Amphibiibacter pelophylacis TaxID=1799477 RepID=A0ACC6P1R0_9BURK
MTENIQTLYRKVLLRFIPFLIVCFVFAYFNRVNISFAKLEMQSDLGFSDAAYGLGASIFFVGYFLFEVPSNLILHRVGARRWIARIMITWGVVSASMMFVTTETQFYVVRFLIGVAEAGFLPGVVLYLTYWFPARERAKVNSVFFTAIAISGVIGGPVSGFVISQMHSFMGLRGWQWLFLIEGLPCVLLGLICLRFLDDGIDAARWLTHQEKILLRKNLDTTKDAQATHSVAHLFRRPEVLLLSVLYILMLMGLYGFTFWAPQLIKNSGVSDPFNVGLLSAIPYAAAGIAMVWVGRHSDQTGERKWHMALCVLLGALGYLLSGLFAQSTLLSMTALTLAAIGVIACLSVFWTMPPRMMAGAAAAGGIAFINSMGNLGGVISPYMVGKVVSVTHSPVYGLYAIAAASLLAFIMIVWMIPAHLISREPKASSDNPSDNF